MSNKKRNVVEKLIEGMEPHKERDITAGIVILVGDEGVARIGSLQCDSNTVMALMGALMVVQTDLANDMNKKAVDGTSRPVTNPAEALRRLLAGVEDDLS